MRRLSGLRLHRHHRIFQRRVLTVDIPLPAPSPLHTSLLPGTLCGSPYGGIQRGPFRAARRVPAVIWPSLLRLTGLPAGAENGGVVLLAGWAVVGMTQQYLVGETSVLLAQLQASGTDPVASRELA
jgi:hypothetical protein